VAVILVNAAAGPLLDVAGKVLTRTDLPDIALIGGLAVTIRVAAHNLPYRATGDIDLVTDDDTPTLVEILTRDQDSAKPVVIDEIKVDVIATTAITDQDLDGIEDGPRLFVASHRWALDTATSVTVATTAAPDHSHRIRVATPAGLIATKSHAVGFARSQRRSTKHGSDLFDVYRLLDVHGPDEIAAALRAAPGRIAPVIADVIRATVLTRPGKAAALMTPVDTPLIDADHVAVLMETFVGALDPR
jgi:hypothetical protein